MRHECFFHSFVIVLTLATAVLGLLSKSTIQSSPEWDVGLGHSQLVAKDLSAIEVVLRRHEPCN